LQATRRKANTLEECRFATGPDSPGTSDLAADDLPFPGRTLTALVSDGAKLCRKSGAVPTQDA